MLPVVHAAEQKLAADDTLNHEYLPVLGFEPFTQESVKLVLGADHKVVKEGKVSILYVTEHCYKQCLWLLTSGVRCTVPERHRFVANGCRVPGQKNGMFCRLCIQTNMG